MATKRICSVADCGKKVKALGFCCAHYKRMKRWGDPLLFAPAREKKVCSVTGCGLPVNAKGLCNKHYPRLRRYGDPARMVNEHKTQEALAFIEQALKNSSKDCILWPFSRNGHGYAMISMAGRRVRVHRIICERVNGAAPEDKPYALHRCGNGHLGCISPSCQYWGSNADNQRDRLTHGTSNRGRRHGNSILNEETVLEIRRLEGTLSRRKIAEKFGLRPDHVKQIHYRASWKWLK